MATVFLSHASGDDDLARQLEAWLTAKGFDDLFVDHSDIRGGDKWTEALRRAKGAARVVLCLVTPRWLASDECFGEFTAAWYAGQRIVPLLATNASVLDEMQSRRRGRVLGEDQGFDLASALKGGGCLDLDAVPAIAEPFKAGLRAAGALAKIGLDPEAFEIDPEVRPSPFPGLQSFGESDADAAIFYGRSPEIARCLEDLREMRAGGVRQPYAILGASGSGKSSLLKAGVLPRLRRERGWLVLRTFRPGADPLFNFAEGIAQSFADHGDQRTPGALRDNLRTTWDRAEKHDGFATDDGLSVLRKMLESEIFPPLRQRANRLGATILIPLDQAEELARTEGVGADVLCDYLRAALLPAPSADGVDVPAADAMIALTARSDGFSELQTARRFAGLDARCADIRSVPVHRFDDVFEKPAEHYGVQIEPGLVEAMIEDAPAADALPLFAFALENLWRQYHEAKRIRKADYDSIGRLDGLIDRAAERALRGIRPEEERPVEKTVPQGRDRLAANTFVPSLVQASETGEPIRRVAPLDRFDARARAILEPFVQWRLLVTKKHTPSNDTQNGDDSAAAAERGGGSTVEVAHEAIFRGWARFQRWLEPARARLEALRGLQTAARVWDRQGRRYAYVDHRGLRLRAARKLIRDPEFDKEIGSTQRAYLAAASRAQIGRRSAIGVTIALVAAIGYGSWWTVENDTNMRVALGLLALKAGWVSLIEPEMVELGGDQFSMGSTELPDAEPHPMTVPIFAIGKYEVTFNEYDIFMLDTGARPPSDADWGRGQRPVIHVSWDDAKAYVDWLSRTTGKEYRLLSEAEWEYAARADTTTPYWWGGEAPTPEQANFGGIVGKTTEVGFYPANPWGLYDMNGNVAEWVEDCWNDSYEHEGRPDDGSAWTRPNCGRRVIRGGSWGHLSAFLRSASRGRSYSLFRYDNIGFRVARTLPRSESVAP